MGKGISALGEAVDFVVGEGDAQGNDGSADGSESSTAFTVRGTATITGLASDTYTLHEVSAPKGYGLADDIKFAPGGDKQILTFADPESGDDVDGSLHVTKVDAQTGDPITGSVARFQLYDSREEGAEPLAFQRGSEGDTTIYELSDATGAELWSDLLAESGRLEVRGLPAGTYYLVEIAAPQGYALVGDTLESATEVVITRNASEVSKAIANEFVSATLNITKAQAPADDAVGSTEGDRTASVARPITGSSATFRLTAADGRPLGFVGEAGGYRYDAEASEDRVTDVLTSPSTGRLQLKGLPKGTYELVEVEAPAGYRVSAQGQTIEISSNDVDDVVVYDEAAQAKLRVSKRWLLQGATKDHALKGVWFELYKADGAGGTASKVAEGVTDADGQLTIDDFDWTSAYYLIEDVPEGYVLATPTQSAYRNDDAGDIVLGEPELPEGYTQVEAIVIDPADAADAFVRDADGELVYDGDLLLRGVDVLNVKPVTYGGLYASISYKTIDNYQAAQLHEGLPAEKAYGFNCRYEGEGRPGERNYVHAVDPGDPVTYTLNVENVSDYEFARLVLIDRMPEAGDTGVVNLDEARSSEFVVTPVADADSFGVTVDGKPLDDSCYEVTFSADKVRFTNADFDGTSEWTDCSESAKSFRVVLADDFRLDPGQTLQVTYDGVIADDALAGQKAWNDFAYRYVAVGDSATAQDARSASAEGLQTTVAQGTILTPEPPKVGVDIAASHTVIEGQKLFEAVTGQDEREFSFKLVRTDDLGYDLLYDDDGDEETAPVALPEDGLVQTVKVKPGQTARFAFPRLTLRHTGRYTFDVTELAGAQEDVRYDERVWHVIVDGSDYETYGSADGIRPTYTCAQEGGESSEAARAEFVNYVHDSAVAKAELAVAKVELAVAKVFSADDADYDGDEDFEFTLRAVEATDADGNDMGPMPLPEATIVTAKAGGTTTFGQVTYGRPGIYYYTISETPGATPGITYAAEPTWVRVDVSEEEHGMVAVVTYGTEDEVRSGTATGVVGRVTNSYESVGTLIVRKVLANADEEDRSKEFAFAVTLYEDEACTRIFDNGGGATTYGDMEFVGSVATITLRPGGEAMATGIPLADGDVWAKVLILRYKIHYQ